MTDSLRVVYDPRPLSVEIQWRYPMHYEPLGVLSVHSHPVYPPFHMRIQMASETYLKRQRHVHAFRFEIVDG